MDCGRSCFINIRGHQIKVCGYCGCLSSFIIYSGFTTIGSTTARSEAAPVAHVHPHPSSPAIVSKTEHHHAPQKLSPDELGLKRSASTDHLTRALAEARLADARLSVDGLWDKSPGTRRWNSYQNLPEEYGVIPIDSDPTLLDQTQFREAEDVFNTRHNTMPRSASAAPYLANSESNLRPLHRDSSLSNSQPSLNGKLTANATNPAVHEPYGHLGKDLPAGGTTMGLHSHTQRRHSEDYVNHSSDLYSHYNRAPTYGGGYSRHGSSGYSLGPAPYSSHGTGTLTQDESLANDITSWQQKHQEQLRQQQLEMSRVKFLDFSMEKKDTLVDENL